MFSGKDGVYLKNKILSGEVILFLGAGASVGSLNSRRQPVRSAAQLEQHFRKVLGETASDLNLGDLAEDVAKQEGMPGFINIMKAEFMDCTPSVELERLFKYTWYRCYTLNYDDAVLRIPRAARAQIVKPFQRASSVEEIRDFNELQLVFLNGSVHHAEEGFVLSDKSYRAELRRAPPWHRKCAQDFANRAFVFVGTQLNEPTFQAQIESLERPDGTAFAKSFLIAPDRPSGRRIQKFAEQNIVYCEGTLADFLSWLRSEIGDQRHPIEIASRDGKLTVNDKYETNIAAQLSEIGTSEWLNEQKLDESGIRRCGRDFYSGIPPTWPTIVNGIPAKLESFSRATKFLEESAKSETGGVHILSGQSGSGKATTLMMSLLELARSNEIRVFELHDGHDLIVERAIEFLSKQGAKNAVLYVPSIHLYADFLEEVSKACERFHVHVVGQVRSSDWSGRFGRKKRLVKSHLELPKLTDQDYGLLTDGLERFAVAPEFRQLTRVERVSSLRRSKRQLLILMIEATKQRRFEEVIENEFRDIPSDDAKALLCTVSLIGMARARLSVGEIEAIYERHREGATFRQAMDQLAGVIEQTPEGKLVGRHDLYVQHVMDNAMPTRIIKNSVLGILEGFTIYGEPFVKRAGRLKGNVLKFLMRARFLKKIFRGSTDLVAGLYEELEYSYQSDGHYWLQRGKFHQTMRQHEVALKHFYRSVEAYPDEYAKHSLAHQKLIVCALSNSPTPHLELLLKEGLDELERQVEVRDDAEDEYPIVALSRMHPEVLLKWGRRNDAMKMAKDYFERLKVFDARLSYQDKSVRETMTQCLHLATQGRWPKRMPYF